MGHIDPKAFALCIVFPVLSILAVAARVWARRLQNAKFAMDDWLIFPALALSIGNAINVLYGAIAANLGQHIPLDPEGFALVGPKIIALEKMIYASETITTPAMMLARWSVLLFYTRIFITRPFRTFVYVVSALNFAWGVSFTLVYLFQCTPIDEIWDVAQGQREHCLPPSMNYYYAVITIITDILVLTAPWPIVWNLKMPVRQKVAVTGIFLLGGIVTAVSIGKCVAFFQIGNIIKTNHDVTYDDGPLFYWTVPECCLSVVCACLPTLRPVFQGMSPESLIGSIRSALSLHSLKSTNGGKIGSRTGRLNTGWEDNNHDHNSTVGFTATSTGPESLNHDDRDFELSEVERGISSITITKDFKTESIERA